MPPKKVRPQSKRNSARSETTQSQDSLPELDPRLVSLNGDLILAVQRNSQDAEIQTGPAADDQSPFLYRVDSKRLREASPYFARLLDPDKFGEGAKVAEAHAQLRTKYPNPAAVPFDELPHVHIAHVGRISESVKSIQNLMADFLRALHNVALSIKLPPLANVANLAIVADRFDALETMRQYFKSHKIMAALDAKSNITAIKGGGGSQDKSLNNEEKVRQKLLAGLLLDNPSWVWHASLRLIHRGWVGHEPPPETSALWWDLPLGIEEEMLYRRDMILETVQSLQSHFMDLYSSRDRQCKLGYDSSPECDVFQLGQQIKFFKKINTLQLQGSIIPSEEMGDVYEGDVFDLLDEIRKVPEYQIDKNHHHCGIRTRIMPLLDLISFSLNQEVGICLHCWQESRNEYAWSRSKRPLVWKHGSAGAAMVQQYKSTQAQKHLFKHLDARDLFMANERLWTNASETTSGMPRSFGATRWLT